MITGRRRPGFELALAILLAGVRPALAYEDLGLRLHSEDPSKTYESMEMKERLARIDEIEARLEHESADADSLLLELGRLYSSSPLMKHRVWAIETEAGLENPHSLAAIRDRAFRYGRTWNPWDSKKAFDELAATYPDSASSQRLRGVFLLNTGLATLDEPRLEEALRSFRRATACADAGYADWLGLASALLATNQRRELRSVGEHLLELEPDRPAGRFYAAVGYEALGLHYEAESLFRSAMTSIRDPGMRAKFLDLEGFLAQFQPVLMHDTMLEQLVPRRLLGWWVRLVECEVLFGDPDHSVQGWDTAPGRVFLLFGRPIAQAYYPPFQRPDMDELTALNPVGEHFNDIARGLGEISNAGGMWLWILKVGDTTIPYVFYKGAAFARWMSTYHSEYTYLEPLKNAMPFSLATRPEEPVPPKYLEIQARHATFRSPGDEIRAESYVAVHPVQVDEDVPLVATLTIVDDDNHVVEKLQRDLGRRGSRVDLLRRLPGTSGDAQGMLTQFAALLPAGHYVFRVEVESPGSDLFAATDQGFELREWRGGFEMSDLELCDSFVDYEPRMDVPAEFVKYARAVVPHPEYRVHPGQESLFVYYELYGAEVDDQQRAHLDTLYEIFDRKSFNPFSAGRAKVGAGAGAARTRLHFPDERIGRSGTGMVVKGTAVDVSELPPGDYVLSVQVSDTIGRHETSRFVAFAR